MTISTVVLTFRRGSVLSARFSPDGHTIVYGAAWDGKPYQLFSTRTDSPESRPLVMPNADVLSISRTGEMAVSLGRHFVVGFMTQGTLARAPLVGGAPRELLTEVEAADWAPNGTDLAAVHVLNGRYRLEYPIGTALYEAEGWLSDPRVSPSGDLVAFIEHPILGDDRGAICIIGPGQPKKTLSADWASANGICWSRSGKEIWFSASEVGPNSALFKIDLSGKKHLALRTPGRLTIQDVHPDRGLLVTEGRFRIAMLSRPGEGAKVQDVSWHDASFAADISPDGKRLIFNEQGTGGGSGSYAIYSRREDDTLPIRLGEGFGGALSPDGGWVTSILGGTPPKLVLLPTGAGPAKTLELGGISEYQSATWFPDGRRLLITGAEPGQPVSLFIQDVSTGKPTRIGPAGLRSNFFSSPISPDGTMIAAIDRSERVVLLPTAGGNPKPLAGLDLGDIPIRWSADGRSFFVFRYAEIPATIHRYDIARARKELLAELTAPDPAGIEAIASVQITPDAKTYCFSYVQRRSDLYLVSDLE